MSADQTKSEYFAQTPAFTLDEIAAMLWHRGEHAAYRALMAYIKERELMHIALRNYESEKT